MRWVSRCIAKNGLFKANMTSHSTACLSQRLIFGFPYFGRWLWLERWSKPGVNHKLSTKQGWQQLLPAISSDTSAPRQTRQHGSLTAVFIRKSEQLKSLNFSCRHVSPCINMAQALLWCWRPSAQTPRCFLSWRCPGLRNCRPEHGANWLCHATLRTSSCCYIF